MFDPYTKGIPVIVVTRFSVFSPSAGGLRLRQEFGSNSEEFERRLFAPERLDKRLDILSHITVPALADASISHNIIHLVQYSENLPDRYKLALAELSEKFEFFKPILVSDSSMADSVRDEVSSWGAGFRGLYAWVRLDDDDVLSKSYFDSLERYLIHENIGMAVSFPIQAATLYSNGLVSDIRKKFIRNPSAGQAYICRANNFLNSFEEPGFPAHHNIDSIIPTIVDPTVVGSLQMLHSTQDTSSFVSPVGGRLINRLSQLSEYGEMSFRDIIAEFPGLVCRSRYAESIEYDAEEELRLGKWHKLSIDSMEYSSEGVVFRVDYSILCDQKSNNHFTLSFDFSDMEKAEGHYPRTKERGDYLRLYADNAGQGSAFIVVPAGTALTRIRLNSDVATNSASSALIKLVCCGPTVTA
ncbi:glycosyltransferase [Corynebacterium sp. HMSC068H04]|uniref:glycosyltransferase n=1 Tax=Corynebacterium sp. HMSC068H04 TaxID=1739296 RepID=UPI0009F41D76|nr:glycosyltransferase [Corynebacterium sp. HMSC068H04]